jgi:hypothetical protein
MTISVIHPSRQRAKRAYSVFRKTIDNAFDKSKINYILSIDNNDPQLQEYVSLFSSQSCVLISHNTTAVEAINSGAKMAVKDGNTDILMVISDDNDSMPAHWDKIIFDATDGKTFWVLKTFDNTQKWIITFPIMDLAFYNKFGYIYNPDYKHMFCDTELASICDMLECVITRNDIIFPHNHYTNGFEKDAVNEKNDLTWKQGEEMYFKRMKENFGLKQEEIKGSIKHLPHLEWIKQRQHLWA